MCASLHLPVQSTIYMEPLPMVELNNTEAMLASAEEEEEMVILTALSRQARPHPHHCYAHLSAIIE